MFLPSWWSAQGCCCTQVGGEVVETLEPELDTKVAARAPSVVDGAPPAASPASAARAGTSEAAAAAAAAFLEDEGIAPADAAAGRPRRTAPAASFRRQVIEAVRRRPPVAPTLAGVGEVIGNIHRQRKAFSEAVINFVFQDAVARDESSTPSAQSPSLQRGISWRSWTDSSLGADQPEPRSLRLSQLVGAPLRLEDGSCAAPGHGMALSHTAMLPGEAEVLLARKTTKVRVVDGRLVHSTMVDEEESWCESASSPSPPRSPSLSAHFHRMASGTFGSDPKRPTSVTDFAMVAQFPTTPHLFRSLVDICQGGPLQRLTESGYSCDEALRGIAEAWPQLAAFFRQIVDHPNVHLETAQLPPSCLQVAFCVPLNISAIAALYPSVSNLVRIARSCRVRFTDRPSTWARTKSGGSASVRRPACAGMKQALTLSYTEDRELHLRFVVHGKHVAWTDEAGQPVVEHGRVAIVDSPIAQSDPPVGKEWSMYCLIDEARLRLSDFGCIGLSSLPLPDISLRLDISTWPESADVGADGPDDLGAPGTSAGPKAPPLGASVAFRVVEITAFPAEVLVRPFFDVRMMRTLMVLTSELSWTMRPCGPSNAWQLLQVVRGSIPKVARAFKACFRAFAQAQVRDSDWLKLMSSLFKAAAQDFGAFEAAASQELTAPSGRAEEAADRGPLPAAS